MATTTDLNFTSFTPSFLNMSGQMGIFRANGRLGFWDSANSVSWNALYDVTDFTPSIETRAGNATFNNILGRIVTIKPQGTGFVIYSTRGIVGVLFSNDVNLIWDAVTIADNCGVAYPRNVTTGITSLEQYAYTNAGIKRIGNYDGIAKQHKYEDIVPEVYDILKESRLPVYLDFLNDRYLFISTLDTKLIYGLVSVTKNTILPYKVRVLENDGQSDIYVPGEIVGPDAMNDVILGELGAPLADITAGVFTKWDSVTGERMVPSRNPSAIYPYNVTNYKVHIDNTGLDLSSQTDPAYLVKLSNGYANYFDENPLATSTGQIETGWIYHGKNVTSSIATLGLMDTYLQEAINTQTIEWSNFSTIQYATMAEINNYPASQPIRTEYETQKYYGTIGVAGDPFNTNRITTCSSFTDVTGVPNIPALIDALVAANTNINAVRIGLNTYRTREVAGWGYTSNGFMTGPTITGAGFTNAKCTYSRTFNETFTVYRVEDTTYTFEYTNYSSVSGILPTTKVGMIGVVNYLVALPPLSGARYEFLYPSTQRTALYTGNADIAFSNMIIEMTPFFNQSLAAVYGATGSLSYVETNPGTYNTNTVVTYFKNSNIYINASPSSTTFTGGSYINDHFVYGPLSASFMGSEGAGGWLAYPEIQIKKVTTKRLEVVIEDKGYPDYVSTFEAYQKKLEWAVISPDVPTNDAIYDKYLYDRNSISIPPISIPALNVLPTYLDVTYPGSTFILQDGSTAPLYPTLKGSLVIDTSLKKWGKMKADFKQLLDMSPLNVIGPTIPYTNFGVDMSLIKPNGSVVLLDARPADSWMRYGKIGYYRLGMTGIEEVKATFRKGSTGEIILDTSMDAIHLESSLHRSQVFTNVMGATMYDSTMGRYHTITISGNFDLQYLELRATITGRR